MAVQPFNVLIILFLGFVFAAGCTPPVGEPDAIRITTPQNKEVHLGDTITLDYDLPADLAHRMDLASLPPVGAVDETLSIREIRTERHPTVDGEVLRLQVVYQIFKAVKSPEPLVIPPLHLRFVGDPPGGFDTPTRIVQVLPTIPADAINEQLELRLPYPPGAKSLINLQHQAVLWALFLLASVQLWVLRRWRHQQTRRRFTAIRRRCLKALNDPDQTRGLERAYRLIHRALDLTYGHPLFQGDLPSFFRDFPQFLQLDQQLHAFYGFSDALFFDPDFTLSPSSDPKGFLKELLNHLILAERSPTS